MCDVGQSITFRILLAPLMSRFLKSSPHKASAEMGINVVFTSAMTRVYALRSIAHERPWYRFQTWTAPEVYQTGYTAKCDIFSFSLVMLSMLTLTPVYQKAPPHLASRIEAGLAIQLDFKYNSSAYTPPILHLPENLPGGEPPGNLYHLILASQSPNPNNRPSAGEIGVHLEDILKASEAKTCPGFRILWQSSLSPLNQTEHFGLRDLCIEDLYLSSLEFTTPLQSACNSQYLRTPPAL